MGRRADVVSIAAGGIILAASWFPLFTYREIRPSLAGGCSAWRPCLGEPFGGGVDPSRALPWLVAFAAVVAVGVPVLGLAPRWRHESTGSGRTASAVTNFVSRRR